MLLLTFHSNYGPILYHFQDEARYLLKITICTPPSFDARISESLSEYCDKVWKTWSGVATWWWEKFEAIFTHFNTTDELNGHQVDIQTP